MHTHNHWISPNVKPLKTTHDSHLAINLPQFNGALLSQMPSGNSNYAANSMYIPTPTPTPFLSYIVTWLGPFFTSLHFNSSPLPQFHMFPQFSSEVHQTAMLLLLRAAYLRRDDARRDVVQCDIDYVFVEAALKRTWWQFAAMWALINVKKSLLGWVPHGIWSNIIANRSTYINSW